jgi:tetratricopeptide (TPR) repeat protein
MTAVQLEPENPDAVGWRTDAAHLQTDLGRPDSALATIRPVLSDTSTGGPRLLYLLGLQYSRDYEAALTEARRLIEEDVGYLRSLRFRFWEVALQALIQLGRMEEAAEVVEILPEEVVGHRPCLRSQYFAAAGDRESALSCFDELRQTGVEPFPRFEAIVLAWLGDLDRAFEILEREIDAKGFVYYFPSDPAFDPLREDPRFEELLAEMGLECRYYEDGHDCFQR